MIEEPVAEGTAEVALPGFAEAMLTLRAVELDTRSAGHAIAIIAASTQSDFDLTNFSLWIQPSKHSSC